MRTENVQTISKSPGIVNDDRSRAAQLTGRTLTIARLVWITLSLLVAGLYIWTLTLEVLSEAEIVFIILMPLGYFAIGLVIFWRKSADLMGLLTSLMLIFFGPYLISGANIVVREQPGFEVFGAIMVGVGGLLAILFLFLFPDGRFVPRWTRGFTLVVSILIVISSFALIWPNLEAIIFLLVAIVGLLSQIYRYFEVSKPIQRQQTKWVLIGFLGPLLVLTLWLIFSTPEVARVPGFQLLYSIISYAVPLLALLFPLTIAFSILRYRLWDIDLLIRRTLVYAVLTALLLLLYFGSVVVLQSIFESLSGQQSPIVVVISTLAIAALFNPLRVRIQGFIDHRFYRKKYDAEQTLARFAEVTRDEVDVEKLTAAFLGVVAETVQPEHVELLLNKLEMESSSFQNRLSI